MARRHARAASALALMLLVALSAAGSDKSSRKQKGSKWNKKGVGPAPADHAGTPVPRTSGDSDVSAPVGGKTFKLFRRSSSPENKDKQKKVGSGTDTVSTALMPVAATPKKNGMTRKVIGGTRKMIEDTGKAIGGAGKAIGGAGKAIGDACNIFKGKKSRRKHGNRRDDTNSQGVGDTRSSEDGHSSRTYTPSADSDEEWDARSVVSASDDCPVPLDEVASTSDHDSATHLLKRTKEQSGGVAEREACVPVKDDSDGKEREAADPGATARPDGKTAAEKSGATLNPGLIAAGAVGTVVAVRAMAWLGRALKRQRDPPRKVPVPARQGVLPRLTKQTGLLFAVPTLAVGAYGLLTASSRATSATPSPFPSKPGAKPGARTIWGMPVWLAIALGFAACIVAVSLITFAIVGAAHKLCPCWF
ncbi:unnamed protein product (mitochondrion) [Plasmodiophora brassicae]|uniref:Transmembrane protein n=1 Tax=Plasmodiophora brassicae TaxID=37360 RepID=A0A0G4ISU5_PLABS|nr:hypothetical protein PBRA_006542 [Plasmodiophora brassicae]SPQ94511.1 unnamed protein product [Plasmodiophora brassicae]